MPSKKKLQPHKTLNPAKAVARQRSSNVPQAASIIFYPLVVLALLVWGVYRAVMKFPVEVDETVGKAVFFGLPVWLYVAATGSREIPETFSLSKLKPGLLLGIAFGGIFGFAGSLLSLATGSRQAEAALLFSQNAFWWEFLLSLFTGFWETLFFFSWIMVGIQQTHRQWSELKQVVWTAIIFALFHIPNAFLIYKEPRLVIGQLILMFTFAVGQGFVFLRRRNAYALVISHAIWGMVLLVHMGFGS
jgi:hypothetical protein